MLKFLRSTALFAALVGTSISITPERAEAQSYQIDCAILLCLAGGWPASVPCARARAEFIRRITPWPIEPPLQIWRCPMGASFETDQPQRNVPRILDAMLDRKPAYQSFPSAPLTEIALKPQPTVFIEGSGTAHGSPEEIMLHLAQQIISGNGKADIDISGAEFDYVRSIKVYHVRFVARREKDYCGEHDSTQIGRYGPQGEFSWHGFSAKSVPTYVMPRVRGCPEGGRLRGVGVEWRDYEGNIGSEFVYY